MKSEIVELIKSLSMGFISETGSWVMFGEKKIPQEPVDEYKNKR